MHTLRHASRRLRHAVVRHSSQQRQPKKPFVILSMDGGGCRGYMSIRLLERVCEEAPGFFRTIFGALSDIPREQPIADNLEAIEGRSRRIRRMQRIIEAIRPEVEASIDRVFGRTLFLNRPTEARLAAWRQKAQNEAAAQAGFAFASYGHLKLSGIV